MINNQKMAAEEIIKQSVADTKHLNQKERRFWEEGCLITMEATEQVII